jgi:hypothetical protein
MGRIPWADDRQWDKKWSRTWIFWRRSGKREVSSKRGRLLLNLSYASRVDAHKQRSSIDSRIMLPSWQNFPVIPDVRTACAFLLLGHTNRTLTNAISPLRSRHIRTTWTTFPEMIQHRLLPAWKKRKLCCRLPISRTYSLLSKDSVGR